MPKTLVRLLAVSLLVGSTACLNNENNGTRSNVVTLKVDTTTIGTLSIVAGTGVDPTSPAFNDKAIYQNTTARTLDKIGISLVERVTTSTESCLPLRAPLSDTVVQSVVPTQQVTVASRILPASMYVYITEATVGGTRLLNATAGRWSSTITEYRSGVAKVYAGIATSGPTGAFTAAGVSSGDSLVIQGIVSLPVPTDFTGYPNNCNALYRGDPATMTASVLGDTLRLKLPTVIDATASGSSTAVFPDSVVVRWVRR